MLVPLAFLLLATLCTAFVAYGVHPAWGQFDWGVSLVCAARRLQWPVLAAATVFALAVVVLVVSGKRRAWWLVGLGPIVALLVHRFATAHGADWRVEDRPQFVPAADVASWLPDDAHVVGLTFGDDVYAYPYAALYTTPVVIHADRDRRLMLMWSAFANKATAVTIDRDIRARELDLVSSPANALLVYNARAGQFINAFTGLTPRGDRPDGLRAAVPTTRTTWGQWRRLRPATRVMLPSGGTGPGVPLAPLYQVPARARALPDRTVLLLSTTPPTAVPTDLVTGQTPINLSAGGARVVLLPAGMVGVPRAFDRQVDDDLVPLFATTTPDDRGPVLIDADSRTHWALDGKAVRGPLAGQHLRPVPVEPDLNLRVVAAWHPDVLLAEPEPPPTIRPDAPDPDPRRRGRARR